MQMKTLVLANQKGGVGKSSTGTQLAFYASREGLRVLYLDLDHQRHSTNPIVRSKLAVVAPFTASQLLRGPLSPLPEGAFVLVAGDDQLVDWSASRPGIMILPTIWRTYWPRTQRVLTCASSTPIPTRIFAMGWH